MSLTRPQVSVYSATETGKVVSTTATPDVFLAPIRPDIVANMTHFLRMNKRQPYAVKYETGMGYAAESWGTGRAVARIPRIPGGGTHRSGQGAFGNMCRGGRMFAPTKTWRRWMHVIPKNQRRYAHVSAIAASGVTALVTARGHRINKVFELPLVVTDDVQSITKTKDAVKFLKTVGAYDDAAKVKNTKRITPGKGKSRNRRHKFKKGPLVVFAKDEGIVRAFRNIPGVDTLNVDALDLLELAPGGHVGRFIVWTESAFKALNTKFGTYGLKGDAALHRRNGTPYQLPRPVMVNTDTEKIIQSDEVQNVIRPPQPQKKRRIVKKNPLKNLAGLVKLNPYAIIEQRMKIKKQRKMQEKLELVKQGKYTQTPAEKKREENIKKSNELIAKNFYNNILA